MHPQKPLITVNVGILTCVFKRATTNFRGNLLIAGDFNFPYIAWSDGFPYTVSSSNCPQEELSPFIQWIHDLSLTQVVDQPTRYRLHQKPSLLDLAFLNNTELVRKINYMPPVGKSDHLLLEIQTPIKKITNILVKKTFVDYISIRADLSNVNRDNIFEGPVEDKWNIFKTLLLDAEKQHTSVKMVPKPKTLPYMTREIRKERNLKSRYWKKYKKKGDKADYAKFATARNKLRRAN